MKVVRFSREGEISYGILDQSMDGAGVEIVELMADPMLGGFDTTGERFPFASVHLLAPVIPRSKVVCIGKNYQDHIDEMKDLTGAPAVSGEPTVFLKPNTAVVGPGDPILVPPQSNQVEFEGELALVIGAVTKNVTADDALSRVFGFTCANDVTARDLQRRDGQWARAKGFDTFCPLGPIIETDPDLEHMRLETRVNGEVRQQAALSQLIHPLAELVSFVSQVFTLLPGDVILTGTPAGVGVIAPGDSVEVEITDIGILKSPVQSA